MPDPPIPPRRLRLMPDKARRVVWTRRDEEIIRLVYRFRVVSRDTLVRAFGMTIHRLNKVLRRLFDVGLLCRYCPVIGGGEGISGVPFIYVPGPAAAEYIAQWGLDSIEEAKRRCRGDRVPYLRHALGIGTLYLDLREALESLPDRQWVLADFLVERECLETYDLVPVGGGTAQRRIVRPDALAILRHQQTERMVYLYLEYDCATVSSASWKAKVESYAEFWRTGAFSQLYGASDQSVDGFIVGLLTMGQRERIRHLAQTARECGAGGICRFATERDIAASGILGAVWTGGDDTTPGPLLPIIKKEGR